MEFGWDGASWQGLPDVAQLKAEGNVFCFEKCTGEGDYINPFFFRVRDACREEGVAFGPYDWVEPQRWNYGEGALAARDYLRTVGGRRAGELLLVDFETPEWANGPMGRDIEQFMRDYLYTLRDEGDSPVGVYLGPYFLIETGATTWDWLGQDFWLWLAAPGPDQQLPDDARWPVAPLPWITVQVHQHQWHATSDAVRGEFDRNRFRGTIEQLRALGKPRTDPEPPPAQGGDVQEPPEGKYTAYINAAGNPIFVWNMGGQTPRILGINVQDLGMTVESATEPGVPIDRSIQGQEVKPFHDRRQDQP